VRKKRDSGKFQERGRGVSFLAIKDCLLKRGRSFTRKGRTMVKTSVFKRGRGKRILELGREKKRQSQGRGEGKSGQRHLHHPRKKKIIFNLIQKDSIHRWMASLFGE